ncbi:MAG: hypothetical protein MEP57_09500 [Microvirga sp.]|nr:hypothetical protein [Microvirga sp.]
MTIERAKKQAEKRRVYEAAVQTRQSFMVRVLASFLVRIFEAMLRAMYGSWRKDVSQVDRLDQLLSGPDRLLILFWHGKYFPLFPMLEGRQVTIFVAPSFRGEVIAGLCRRFGYTASMLPGQSRNEALEWMRTVMQSDKAGVLAADGPLGPRHQVKSGIVALASELGLAVLAVSAASSPKLVMKRWDRREVPLPFARVAFGLVEPVKLDDGEEAATWGESLREALEAADIAAESLMSEICYPP